MAKSVGLQGERERDRRYSKDDHNQISPSATGALEGERQSNIKSELFSEIIWNSINMQIPCLKLKRRNFSHSEGPDIHLIGVALDLS